MVRVCDLAILVATASASLLRRDECNPDNCLTAVVASNAAPGPDQAAADCASFLLTAATPCPVTSIATVSTTPTVSVTASASVTTTSTVTSTVSATSTITTTTTVTSTITTSTITRTSSVASLDPTGSSNKRGVNVLSQNKRGSAEGLPLPGLIPNAAIVRRAAATTCPSVGSPSTVPTYVSACSDASQYSSACSCIGVTGSKTTLSPVTSSVTVTMTGAPVTSTVATLTSTSTEIITTLTTITSATVTSTRTVTATTTITTGAVATTTVGYAQAYRNTTKSRCVYDFPRKGSLGFYIGSTDPTNDYQAGRQQCAKRCAESRFLCKAFSFTVDIFKGYCFLLDHQYTASDINCSDYPSKTIYIVEYNRDS